RHIVSFRTKKCRQRFPIGQIEEKQTVFRKRCKGYFSKNTTFFSPSNKPNSYSTPAHRRTLRCEAKVLPSILNLTGTSPEYCLRIPTTLSYVSSLRLSILSHKVTLVWA